MAKMSINGVRSVDLGVADLAGATKFYTETWGLVPVAERPGSIYLRGTGAAHHIVVLHERPNPALLRIDLTAADKAAVDGLHAQIRAAGVREVETPAAITEPGGGYGFAFQDLQGRTLRVLTADERHADTADHRDRPRKISHVVLNAKDAPAAVEFYTSALGFKVSDWTAAMTFIRCSSDHHSIALVKSEHDTLHHIAFEMMNLDAVMRGAGRMRDAGYSIDWGVGRHGPGNNVFAYYVGPAETVIEYTAEVEQVDDSYVAHGPDFWTWPAGRIDHWGVGTMPTERMKHAHASVGSPAELFHPAAG